MADRRNSEWGFGAEIYTPDQVEAVLKEIGVEVREETGNDFVSYCPYHGNFDTPAFSTSKTFGYSVCFNPSCAVGTERRLTLDRLVQDKMGVTNIEAKRLIKLRKDNSISFEDRFDSIVDDEKEMVEFPSAEIDKMHARLKETQPALEYLTQQRGFELNTLDLFKIGFTPETRWPAAISKPDMIVVPAYDHKSRPVGLVGRSLVGKEFKNFGAGDRGKGFHKSQIIWNLNNARRYETLIVTESTFDSMRVHQAGYPNVGALLGGSLSNTQANLIKRHFNKVIIMTDNETGNDVNYPINCRKCLSKSYKMCQGHQPGRDLGMKIAQSLPNVRIMWAAYDDKYVYANDVKDAAAMTDDEIRQALRNAVSHLEYMDWIE